jgi:hypothetical protein
MNHVVTLALILAGSTAAADHLEIYKINRIMHCSDKGTEFTTVVMQEFQEDLLLTGDIILSTVSESTGDSVSSSGTLSLIVNQNTGTFTVLVEYPWGTVNHIQENDNEKFN